MPFTSGVLAIGTVERSDDYGLPVRSGPVVARISKALGLPGGTRDVAGLALRLPTDTGEPWDLLMTTAGGPGTWQRRMPRTTGDWLLADFSSLTPFEHERRRWWVRARCATSLPAQGLSLDTIVEALHGGGVEFSLTQAASGRPFHSLGWLTLHGVHREAGDGACAHRLADLRATS